MSTAAQRSVAPDQAERDRALDIARSFIVQAPAGSGKTTLLVARYLKLLDAVERPEEILAITFTNKAAGEMKKRVIEKLGPRARDIAHRLRIETIDAFCLSVARQLPVLSQFGAPPGIADDLQELYAEAALAVVTEYERPAVARLLAHLDNNIATAQSLLAAMLARRDQWLRQTGRAPTRDQLEAALASERERVLERARAALPDASPELAAELLTQKGEWRKKHKRAQSLAEDDADGGVRRALAALLALPPAAYTDAQWAVLAAMLELLPLAVANLKLVFAARGQCDYVEIAQGALRALGTPEEPTDLLLAFDHRIRHILIDEFQDTAWSQRDLLLRLTAGWQVGDGRTLFVVGDPMQSIYRFRAAEVELFQQAWREGLPQVPLETVRLTTNFRAQQGLVAFYNDAFARIFPVAADVAGGAVPYATATADPAKPLLAGAAATWHAPDDREAEAAQVVDIVRAAGRGCAVLVRNRNALGAIVPALKTAGIRFRAIEIETLGEKQVVQDLYALTRALTHLADRVAWLALLRAPWCGATLAQLSAWCEGRSETVWEIAQEHVQAVPELQRLCAVLAPALAARQRGTLRDRVEGVWLALGGPACVADATDLEDAEVYLDALEDLEEAGEVDFGRLAELLDELYAAPDVTAGDDDVQIMTIHKAKGLEFDTVIVPGLERGPGRGDPPLMLWRTRPAAQGGDILLAPIKETGADKELVYEYLKALEIAAEDTESARILYVAATRAQSRLHLLACPKKTMPPKRSLLACAWPVAAAQYADAAPPAGASAAPAAVPPTRFVRLPQGWQLPAAPAAAVWRAPALTRQEQDLIEFSWAGETARHVGSVVHRWMQRIAEDALAGWAVARVEALRPRLARELEARGVAPAACAEAAARAARALAQTLGDARGRWLLGPHAAAQSEYRVRVAAGDGVRTCIMDRVFTDETGTRWIVDYKTGGHEGGEVDAFLDRERERYQGQLARYARALADGTPQKLGLYFPLLAGWREWEDTTK